MIINMTMNEPTRYYKMPPVGITETRARIGHLIYTQQTVRCGNRNCWWVGNAANSTDAQLILDTHQTSVGSCPQVPARNELPSGYSTIEKLWDELDDVTRAIMSKNGWVSYSVLMEDEMLKGYARGIAFALSMMTHPHFRTVKDIVIECAKRYKIYKGLIPFEPTPTYRYNPVTPAEPPPGEKQAFHGKTVESRPLAGRTRAARPAAKKAAMVRTTEPILSAEQKTAIRASHSAGFFSPLELAKMYSVSVDTITRVVLNPGV